MNTLMLVSTSVTSDLRRQVAAGLRPTPEYLRLEEKHGFDLLDWTQAGLDRGGRSVQRSLRHVAVAVGSARHYDVVFSDGEHLGIPMSMAMGVGRIHASHAMIGHNLLTPAKTRLLRWRPVSTHLNRVFVHSANQVEQIVAESRLSANILEVIPYGVDASFWSPQRAAVDPLLVASAGREHRDYRTLVAAMPPQARLVIADHSPYTPHATRTGPGRMARAV